MKINCLETYKPQYKIPKKKKDEIPLKRLKIIDIKTVGIFTVFLKILKIHLYCLEKGWKDTHNLFVIKHTFIRNCLF